MDGGRMTNLSKLSMGELKLQLKSKSLIRDELIKKGFEGRKLNIELNKIWQIQIKKANLNF